MHKIEAEAERSIGYRHVEVPGRAVMVQSASHGAGFAAISAWFELTDHFEQGRSADDEAALSVVNSFVAILKLAGVVLAVLAVHPRLVAPRTVGTLLWAAFATLTVYVVGSIAQAFVMLVGIARDADQVDAASIAARVPPSCSAAAGFGILAGSHARPGCARHSCRR